MPKTKVGDVITLRATRPEDASMQGVLIKQADGTWWDEYTSSWWTNADLVGCTIQFMVPEDKKYPITRG